MKQARKVLNCLVLSAAIGAGVLVAASPASAYVACNRFGDCWHTDTRVHFPHVRLSFHNDKWWDRHRNNAHYTWHEIDNSHDWHHGYWEHGTWHSL